LTLKRVMPMGAVLTIPLYAIAGVALLIAAAAAGAAVYLRRARRKAARLEEEVRKTESLAFIGTLAGGLAHEIRNPLSTLAINLQLLKEDWDNPITSKEQRSVKRIETLLRETRRLEQVLSDFLRFAGRYQLHREPQNVNAVVDEILDFVGPEARQRKIAIRKELDPSVPPLLLDAGLLKQALLNLVKNAEEAMPGGGDLVVRTHRNKRAVQIDVADTGIGIPPGNLDKIFQVYFTTKAGGSGLGLPVAKRIVEEHHGAIEVESRPGQGARFSIRLPLD
jgi:signal transduction histidine kinase